MQLFPIIVNEKNCKYFNLITDLTSENHTPTPCEQNPNMPYKTNKAKTKNKSTPMCYYSQNAEITQQQTNKQTNKQTNTHKFTNTQRRTNQVHNREKRHSTEATDQNSHSQTALLGKTGRAGKRQGRTPYGTADKQGPVSCNPGFVSSVRYRSWV